MGLNGLRFVALVLAALALTMTSAHLLELPQKMQYGPALYSAVNTTLYRYFATVGGAYQVTSIVAAGVLAFLVRRHVPAYQWTLFAAVCLGLALVSWTLLVAPVNNQIAAALERAPQSVPALWMRLRDRWEYGHAAGFVIQLVGFGALVKSLLVEIPGRGKEPRTA
jgi:Domain of unknown function (DUF1772)